VDGGGDGFFQLHPGGAGVPVQIGGMEDEVFAFLYPPYLLYWRRSLFQGGLEVVAGAIGWEGEKTSSSGVPSGSGQVFVRRIRISRVPAFEPGNR